MQDKKIKIMPIDEMSSFLEDVKHLWRTSSDTLGFFTDGAFIDYTKQRNVLVILVDEKCVGYLLYRQPYDRVAIVHLCIHPLWGGKGLARRLVEYLKLKTKKHRGIGLWCRRDYKASKLWPKLGFIAQGDKVGRSSTGKELTFWWFDHNHPDLFSISRTVQLEAKIYAVMDANIFYDLHGDKTSKSDESKTLASDWIQEAVELCVTEEIFNEIERHTNTDIRRQQRVNARSYTSLNCPNQDYQKITGELQAFFPDKKTESDASDLRQLARTIASNIKFFITRDERLLGIAEGIYDSFEVTIIRPSKFIVYLDRLQKEVEYQPVRLAGTFSEMRLVQEHEEASLIRQFLCYKKGEKKSDLQKKLRRFLADPEKYRCNIAIDKEGGALALVVYGREKCHDLELPIFRVKSGPLKLTIAQFLASKAVLQSAKEKRTFTRITDSYLDNEVFKVFEKNGFIVLETKELLKINIAAAETAKELMERLVCFMSSLNGEKKTLQEIYDVLKVTESTKDSKSMLALERILWPVKILDAEIPTYIIPIKPHWAQDLFDDKLARQTLFGAKLELALNCENVYYGSIRRNLLPGRILWYVSSDNKYRGTGHLRACSSLDEIVVDKPKALFKQFKRLGVYRWPHILKLAKNDIDKEIMAIRFSNTELFDVPISWRDLQEILRAEGFKSQIQSPLTINHKVFERLYVKGIKVKRFC